MLEAWRTELQTEGKNYGPTEGERGERSDKRFSASMKLLKMTRNNKSRDAGCLQPIAKANGKNNCAVMAPFPEAELSNMH